MPISLGPDAFVCLTDDDPVGISLFGIFWKVFIPCFFWGSGTAMGEIPPYWISYAGEFLDLTVIRVDLCFARLESYPALHLFLIRHVLSSTAVFFLSALPFNCRCTIAVTLTSSFHLTLSRLENGLHISMVFRVEKCLNEE